MPDHHLLNGLFSHGGREKSPPAALNWVLAVPNLTHTYMLAYIHTYTHVYTGYPLLPQQAGLPGVLSKNLIHCLSQNLKYLQKKKESKNRRPCPRSLPPKHHPKPLNGRSPIPMSAGRKCSPTRTCQGNEKLELPPKGHTNPKTQEMKLVIADYENAKKSAPDRPDPKHGPKKEPLCGKFALSNE